MKRSIICMMALLLAFSVPAFCEESATVAAEKTQEQVSTPAAVNTVEENKEAAATTEVAPATEENKAEQETEAKVEQEVKEEPATAPVTDVSEATEAKEDSSKKEKSEKKKIFNYSKETSKTEIEIKVGRTVNPKPEVDRNSVDVDSVYTLGIEVIAYSNSFVGLGAGIYNIFDSKIKQDGTTVTNPKGEEYEVAFTNPYLTLKSKVLQFDSDIIRNVYIYGQIGYGFMRIKNAFETEDGMYWGIGAGVDIWHFLIDVNYATNFGKIKVASGAEKLDVRQSTLIVSLGYRFKI